MHMVLTYGKLVQIGWHQTAWVCRQYFCMLCHIYTSFINIMIMSMELELIKIISSICNKGTRNTIPYLNQLPPGHKLDVLTCYILLMICLLVHCRNS